MQQLGQESAVLRKQAIGLMRTMAGSEHLKRYYIAAWECMSPLVYRRLQVFPLLLFLFLAPYSSLSLPQSSPFLFLERIISRICRRLQRTYPCCLDRSLFKACQGFAERSSSYFEVLLFSSSLVSPFFSPHLLFALVFSLFFFRLMAPWLANFEFDRMMAKDSTKVMDDLIVLSYKFSEIFPQGFFLSSLPFVFLLLIFFLPEIDRFWEVIAKWRESNVKILVNHMLGIAARDRNTGLLIFSFSFSHFSFFSSPLSFRHV